MKNTKEAKAILTALFCIEATREERDKEALQILDYAFRRFFGANTNLLSLATIEHTKESIWPQIIELLEIETEFKKYMEEYRK